MRLLSNLLRRFIRQGTLRVRDADGKVHVFGERIMRNLAQLLADRLIVANTKVSVLTAN